MSNLRPNRIGHSLHLGLNFVDPDHYGGWDGKLYACENDARDMQILADSQGYQSTLLLRKEVTRKNVKDFLYKSAQELVAGDILLVTYSGHGSHVPDLNNDERDARDETLCLYDGQIIDDELLLHWSKFQEGVRILVISDSCHSGDITRERFRPKKTTEFASKDQPFEYAFKTYMQNKDFYDSINLRKEGEVEIEATVRLISACQENQLAYDGMINSVFTQKLLYIWNGGKYDQDYSRFHRDILDIMPPEQTPNHLVFGQSNPRFAAEPPFKI
ncbi:MAG: caspase family protein [Bacteroidota bacterium]